MNFPSGLHNKICGEMSEHSTCKKGWQFPPVQCLQQGDGKSHDAGHWGHHRDQRSHIRGKHTISESLKDIHGLYNW